MINLRMFVPVVIGLMVVTVNGANHKKGPKDMGGFMFEFILAQLETMESRMMSTFDERMNQLERNIGRKIENAVETLQKKSKTMLRNCRKFSVEELKGVSNLTNEVRHALVSGEQRLAELLKDDAIKKEGSDVKHRLDTLSAQLMNLTSSSAAHSSLVLRRMENHMDKITKKSGVYAFRAPNVTPFWAYRDSTNNHGFGNDWIVIQRRFEGSIEFNRNWEEYCKGFGHKDGEHWLGLRKLYDILSTGRHDLLLVLEVEDKSIDYVHFDNFEIGNEKEQFVLKSLGNQMGNSMIKSVVNTKFATYDKGNGLSCPTTTQKGWWLKSCTDRHINSAYHKGSGIACFIDNKFEYHWKTTKLMIRLHE